MQAINGLSEEDILDSESERISSRVKNHQNIHKAVDSLIMKEHFCFLKLQNCNGAYPVSFSKAWCAAVRNTEDEDDGVWRTRVRFSDLFNVELLQQILNNSIDVSVVFNTMLFKLCDKLIQFLDKINDVSRILEKHQNCTDTEWAALFGTHVLRPLALMDSMLLSDGDYSTGIKTCPCGCKIPVVIGDTSIGHESVWHGSVDILLGMNVVVCNASGDYKQFTEEREPGFEIKKHNVETMYSQIIAQTMVSSLMKNIRVVPTIVISKDIVKIFMYDPGNDLLYESTQMKLFRERGRPVLNTHSVLALWFAINYCQFCTGTKPSHIAFGYKADFQACLDQAALNTYKNKLHYSNCKFGENTLKKEFSYDSYEEVKFL